MPVGGRDTAPLPKLDTHVKYAEQGLGPGVGRPSETATAPSMPGGALVSADVEEVGCSGRSSARLERRDTLWKEQREAGRGSPDRGVFLFNYYYTG